MVADSESISEFLSAMCLCDWNPALELLALPTSQPEWGLMTAWCEMELRVCVIIGSPVSWGGGSSGQPAQGWGCDTV